MLAEVIRAMRQVIEIIRSHSAEGDEVHAPFNLGRQISPVEDIPIDHGNRAARHAGKLRLRHIRIEFQPVVQFHGAYESHPMQIFVK